ncbi:MAG: hypothetical protein FWG83_02100 [Oscillospiraceae bacterium]|nr:hypothetical protein [Oscillospiraceae bacterium]
MKKIVIMLMSAALLLTSLTSCAPDKPESNPRSPEEIYEKLVESGFFDVADSPLMKDISPGRIADYKVEPDLAVSYVAKEAAISSFFVQLLIIEAKEGESGAVYNAMLEHQSDLLDETFYPQGRIAAAASIVGRNGNIVYLICDERAAEIETQMFE